MLSEAFKNKLKEYNYTVFKVGNLGDELDVASIKEGEEVCRCAFKCKDGVVSIKGRPGKKIPAHIRIHMKEILDNNPEIKACELYDLSISSSDEEDGMAMAPKKSRKGRKKSRKSRRKITKRRKTKRRRRTYRRKRR